MLQKKSGWLSFPEIPIHLNERILTQAAIHSLIYTEISPSAIFLLFKLRARKGAIYEQREHIYLPIMCSCAHTFSDIFCCNVTIFISECNWQHIVPPSSACLVDAISVFDVSKPFFCSTVMIILAATFICMAPSMPGANFELHRLLL